MTNLNHEIPNLNITDAHVHFWDTDALTYPWLDDVPFLKKTFDMPAYRSATETVANINKVVFVQCECLPQQYLAEVECVTSLANKYQNIQGIVAYFPIEKDHAQQQLENLAKNKLIKGIRRLEEDDSLYRNPAFIKNLSFLKAHGLSFDICVKSHQLPAAVHMVQQQPDIPYMLDHLGKPDIRHQEFNEWSAAIKSLAKNSNVYCKISGLLTEADPEAWQLEDLKPYFMEVCEQFGADRMVFGSDWPVVTMVDSYSCWFDTFLELSKDFSAIELQKVLSENANRFYKLI
jgi:L-fuconolactonase